MSDAIAFLKIKDARHAYYISPGSYETLVRDPHFNENALDMSAFARNLLIRHCNYVINREQNCFIKQRSPVETDGKNLTDVVFGTFGGSLEKFMDNYVFTHEFSVNQIYQD